LNLVETLNRARELAGMEPLSEAAAKKISSPSYKITWEGYPNNPKPETHGIEYFTDDLAFDNDDRNKIKDLGVGDKHVMAGPMDSVTVVRIK